MKQFLYIVRAAVIIYLLYIKGYLVINRKAALTFIGKRNRNGRGATFTGCSGYVSSVIPLEKGRTYIFDFDSEVTGGSVHTEIRLKGQTVLLLDEKNNRGKVTAGNGIYSAKTVFSKASGIYYLKWDEAE